MFKLHSLY